jgi:hypothetical protein
MHHLTSLVVALFLLPTAPPAEHLKYVFASDGSGNFATRMNTTVGQQIVVYGMPVSNNHKNMTLEQLSSFGPSTDTPGLFSSVSVNGLQVSYVAGSVGSGNIYLTCTDLYGKSVTSFAVQVTISP